MEPIKTKYLKRPISTKNVKKHLSLVPETFTTRDLLDALNKRSLYPKKLSTVSSTIRNMINCGAVEIKEKVYNNHGNHYVYKKTGLY